MRTDPAVFELLRRSVLDRADASFTESVLESHGDDRVVRAACWHGVENHLLLTLRRLGPDYPSRAPLEALYHQSAAVHLRAVADIAAVSPLLAARGIPALVVKGPVLGQLYPHPDLRAYSDLDVVVPRDRFAATVDILQRAGCELLDRDWKLILDEHRTQVHLRAPHGTPVDLHWHLINREVARAGLRVDIDGLFERARETRVSGVPCLTTDPIDTARHVIVHAGVQGGARLSQLADVRQVIAAVDDPELLVRRIRSWGAGEMAAIVLARVARVLEVEEAGRTASRLSKRRGWSTLVRRVEPRARPELGGDNGLVARLTRAARPTRSRSAVAAIAWLWVQTRVRVRDGVPGRGATAPGAADRVRLRYFAAVSHGAAAGAQDRHTQHQPDGGCPSPGKG